MLLQHRTAIVHGAGGAVGSAVARAFAREAAEVHLTGRTRSTLEEVAGRISQEGGDAHAVAEQSGGIDICFNATSNDDVQGKPLVNMAAHDLLKPVTKAVTTTSRTPPSSPRPTARRH